MLPTPLYEGLFNEAALLNTKKMITLGDIIDKITAPFSRDKKKGNSGGGILDGLTLHFHIAINLVRKEEGV